MQKGSCHNGASGLQHDLPAADKHSKFFSVDIKCREVLKKEPKSFNWRADLLQKALGKWSGEVSASPGVAWGGRLLVFVQLAYPCHRGDCFTTHGASKKLDNAGLEFLWDWLGFPVLPTVVVRAQPERPVAQSQKLLQVPSEPPQAVLAAAARSEEKRAAAVAAATSKCYSSVVCRQVR